MTPRRRSPTATPDCSTLTDSAALTAALRSRVLAAWAASPSRFREDANAEEDAVRGGYRDRLGVELLQNAVDAARVAGVPARVLLRMRRGPHAGLLECANTGAALSAPGIEALSTLRASAKRGDDASVGRFGVGFAAVLAVSDAPSVVSRLGPGDQASCVGVAWSAEATRDLVEAVPELAGELAARGGAVPVLRLPFALAAPEPPPPGYDTVVRLPLRDPGATQALLDGLDPTLPLVLPGLAELIVETDTGRRETRVAERDGVLLAEPPHPAARWLSAEVAGELPPELLAGLGVEERSRRRYTARALWPEGGWPGGVPRVLRAPQPTDEPLSLPVLLSVPVPLEPTRRRTLPGPLRRHLLAAAAAAVADLAARVPGPAVLALVPTGLPAGEVDGELAAALLARLRADPPLPGRRALDLGPATDAAYPVLAEVLDGLLPPRWPVASPALAALGVERLDTAAVVEALAGVDATPGWWRRVYDALERAPDRDALGALPVPLADGRRSPGPRGVLLAEPGLDRAGVDLAGLGLRVVHPEAASEALLALGAVPATPRTLLAELGPRIEASYDADDTDLADPVLRLVAAAGLGAGELPNLAGLTLRDADGEPAPAGELVLPDGPLAAVLAPDAPLGVVAADLVAQWGAGVLVACGVADGLVVVRGDAEVALLDDGPEWLDTAADPAAEPVGVRDLDLLRWPEALPLLRALPAEALPYARWWCSRRPVLGGLLPGEVLGPGADPLLRGLYDEPPPQADIGLLACRTALPEDDADLLDLLDRLGDGSRSVTRAQARALYCYAADRAPRGEPPLTVRGVAPGGAVVVVPAGEAVLVDAPDLLPLVGARPVVPAAARLAAALSRLLGVPLASGLASYDVVSADPLLVADADGRPVPVLWRLGSDGVVHAPTPAGRGRAEAWRDGRWEDRLGYVERLRDPAAAALLDAEDDLAG